MINYSNEIKGGKMSNLVIEVFGKRNGYPESKGCGCGPQLTMQEMFDEFENRINTTIYGDSVELKFIDIDQEELSSYEYAKNALDNGYLLPLTAINSRVRFHNDIPFNQLLKLIKTQIK